MYELEKNRMIFRLLMSVWYISVFLSAAMYTIGLIYEEKLIITIACLIGLLSLTGTIYTGYSLAKVKNAIKYFKEKNKK